MACADKADQPAPRPEGPLVDGVIFHGHLCRADDAGALYYWSDDQPIYRPRRLFRRPPQLRLADPDLSVQLAGRLYADDPDGWIWPASPIFPAQRDLQQTARPAGSILRPE